jgi:integrase
MVVKEGHYLSFEDIQKLENFEIENKKLYQTKLLFLFTIYTGLSFIDLYKSKESDLIIDDDGMYWLKTFRQKSKSRVSVPLIGKSGQCDHPNPVEADHPNPEQTDQANPEQIDHPLSYQ